MLLLFFEEFPAGDGQETVVPVLKKTQRVPVHFALSTLPPLLEKRRMSVHDLPVAYAVLASDERFWKKILLMVHSLNTILHPLLKLT